MRQLHRCEFIDGAQNIVLVGGRAPAKRARRDRPRRPGYRASLRKVRFFSTIKLVNALEQEKARGKAGQIAEALVRLDLLILDELGYPSVQCLGWSAALPLAEQALRAHQRRHHHQPPASANGLPSSAMPR